MPSFSSQSFRGMRRHVSLMPACSEIRSPAGDHVDRRPRHGKPRILSGFDGTVEDMTNSPGGPDWYPDPTGKPGLMYWDGRQWHADVPAATPPAEGPPVPPAPTAARP
ncbi:DUF2510 domain-containing protein, partial [Mycobacterium alsense]|uniref:DUF2510 domain-containing protein n=1 Tax=Mycobacterium alsense TaxID=324058 RepID=UPI00197C3DF2